MPISLHDIKSALKSRKGSLLLEALLSITILSVSLSLIIRSMTASMRATVYGADFNTAIFLAENELTLVLAEGFIESDVSKRATFKRPNQKFKYHLRTKPMDDVSENINKVELTTQWVSGKKDKNLLLETYMLNPVE